MNNNKALFPLVVLTFIGMVGIYIGAAYAWQKYQAYKAQAGSLSGATSLLTGILGN